MYESLCVAATHLSTPPFEEASPKELHISLETNDNCLSITICESGAVPTLKPQAPPGSIDCLTYRDHPAIPTSQSYTVRRYPLARCAQKKKGGYEQSEVYIHVS